MSCNGGNNGAVDLTVIGGNPPYTYNWSNGETTQDISNLTAGAYNVMIIDANGCVSSISATVNQPDPLIAVATPSTVSCNGGNNGTIPLSVSGGTPTYTYIWSTSPVKLRRMPTVW